MRKSGALPLIVRCSYDHCAVALLHARCKGRVTSAIASATRDLAWADTLMPASVLQGVVVSIFSVANCVGRMSTASLPETLFGHTLPRTHFFVLGCFATGAAAFIDAVSTLSMLPYTALVTGVSTGSPPLVLYVHLLNLQLGMALVV
jgi:hypothetical protein